MLLAVLASLLSFRMPAGDVRFSLSLVFAIIGGVVLGKKGGAAAQGIFVVIGLMGAPIFQGGAGGIFTFGELWFGYTLALIPAAYLAGHALVQKGKPLNAKRLFVSLLPALLFFYAAGLAYQTAVIMSAGGGIRYVWDSISGVPLLLLIDAVIIFLFCIIYPKLTDTQKIEEKGAAAS